MFSTESIKLNLGCGGKILDGYINIDAIRKNGADLVLDISEEELPFENGWVEEIVLQDVLEYIYRDRQEFVLQQCYDKLKHGGKLFIQVPDLEVICKRYCRVLENPTSLQHWLDGEEVAKLLFAYSCSDNVYDNHKWAFDQYTLRALLEKIGFKIQSIGSDGGSNLLCLAIKE